MGSKVFPLDHVTPLLCPDAGQINLSTWHHFLPCSHRHKSDLHAMCYICSLFLWVLMKRMAEPVLCQNRAPQLPSSPLLLLRTCRVTCKVVFLLWLVSVFHLFPGMAFLKHLDFVTFAGICKVHVICLALHFQKQLLLRFTYRYHLCTEDLAFNCRDPSSYACSSAVCFVHTHTYS